MSRAIRPNKCKALRRAIAAAWLFALDHKSDRPWQVTVFLKHDITDSQRRSIQAAIEEVPIAKKVTYTSKDTEVAKFRKLYGDQPELWKGIDASSFPATFHVDLLAGRKGVSKIHSALHGVAGVQVVDRPLPTYGSRWRRLRNAWGVITLSLLLPASTVAAIVAGRRS